MKETAMETTTGFRAVGEVVADDRARIAFGKTGVRKDDRYAISVNDDGAILLTPLATIPRRELLIWENAELRASLARGLDDSAAGRVSDLGDFTQFVDDETEAEETQD
jgi:hypothetical protein